MVLSAGTSGWAYPEWKPDFYPDGLSAKKMLGYYAERLTGCEINATFYRLQRTQVLQSWAEQTPPSFRFTTKAHRRITHGKVPFDDLDLVDAFVRSVGQLGQHLGAVLFQLPAYRHRSDADLERLLLALPESLPFAFEFRHPSWFEPVIVDRITSAGGTLCVSDDQGEVPSSLPAGRIAYVRLRAEHYSPGARERWRALLHAESLLRDTYVFAKHESASPRDAYAGVGLACWLAEQARQVHAA